MVKKISILMLLAFAVAIVGVAPLHADGVGVHVKGDLSEGPSNDTDRTPDHRQVDIGESFVLKLDKSSVFDGDASEDTDADSDSNHSVHNTAEWVWWLKDKDKKKFDKDKDSDPVSAPEPTSLTVTETAVTTPEPSSVGLMLLGIGLVFVLRKRGLSQAG